MPNREALEDRLSVAEKRAGLYRATLEETVKVLEELENAHYIRPDFFPRIRSVIRKVLEVGK